VMVAAASSLLSGAMGSCGRKTRGDMIRGPLRAPFVPRRECRGDQSSDSDSNSNSNRQPSARKDCCLVSQPEERFALGLRPHWIFASVCLIRIYIYIYIYILFILHYTWIRKFNFSLDTFVLYVYLCKIILSLHLSHLSERARALVSAMRRDTSPV